MPIPALFLTLAALQATAPPAPTVQLRHMGRTFISPMGEPFRVGTSGEDGLTAWFQQADLNRDGSLTLDEVKKDAQRFFLTLDKSQDGEIDPEDLENYENVVAPEVRSGMSWGGVTGDGASDEATGGGALGLLTIPEPVAAADTNFNRGVSAVEFEQAAVKRFQLLDSDHNGKLTLPELEARRQAVRSNARRPPPSPNPQTSDNPPSKEN